MTFIFHQRKCFHFWLFKLLAVQVYFAIVSDELANFLPEGKKLRDARRNVELEEKLRSHQDLKGLREDELFSFRGTTSGESYNHVFKDKEPRYYIIPPKN